MVAKRRTRIPRLENAQEPLFDSEESEQSLTHHVTVLMTNVGLLARDVVAHSSYQMASFACKRILESTIAVLAKLGFNRNMASQLFDSAMDDYIDSRRNVRTSV